MKLCVIGDSQVASLKLGWDAAREQNRQIDVTFFAGRYPRLSHLELENDSLVPKEEKLAEQISYTSGGKDRISIGDYDAFLICEWTLRLPILASSLTSAVCKQTCVDIFQRSIGRKLAEMVRGVTHKPILIAHAAQKSLDPEADRLESFLDYSTVRNLFAASIDIEASQFVGQPISTIAADGWHTEKSYSIGSRRLDVGDKLSNKEHLVNDIGHMNEQFGRLWWRSAVEESGVFIKEKI